MDTLIKHLINKRSTNELGLDLDGIWYPACVQQDGRLWVNVPDYGGWLR